MVVSGEHPYCRKLWCRLVPLALVLGHTLGLGTALWTCTACYDSGGQLECRNWQVSICFPCSWEHALLCPKPWLCFGRAPSKLIVGMRQQSGETKSNGSAWVFLPAFYFTQCTSPYDLLSLDSSLAPSKPPFCSGLRLPSSRTVVPLSCWAWRCELDRVAWKSTRDCVSTLTPLNIYF